MTDENEKEKKGVVARQLEPIAEEIKEGVAKIRMDFVLGVVTGFTLLLALQSLTDRD